MNIEVEEFRMETQYKRAKCCIHCGHAIFSAGRLICNHTDIEFISTFDRVVSETETCKEWKAEKK